MPDPAAARPATVDDLIEQGRFLLRAGHADTALASFEAAYQMADHKSIEPSKNTEARDEHTRCCYWRAAAFTQLQMWSEAEQQTYELIHAVDSYDTNYARGRYYLAAGGFDDAIACFDRALEHNQKHERSLRDRIKALRRSGMHEKSCEFSELSVELVPDSLALRSELVKSWISAGLYDRAAVTAYEILDYFPDNPEAYVILAMVLVAQQQGSKAMECCERALEIDGMHRSALLTKSWIISRQRSADTKLSPLSLEPPDEQQAQHGESKRSAGSAVDAMDEVLITLKRNRLVREANAWESKQDFAEALKNFRSAGEIDPDSLTVLRGQLNSLRLLGSLDEAREMAEDAIKRHPSEWSLYVESGRIAHYDGKFEEALQWFAKAKDRSDAEIDICVAESITLCALGWYDEARRTVNDFQESYPDDFRLLEEQAWIAYYERRFDDADHEFSRLHDKVAADAAERAKANYGRGYVLFARGDFNNARSFFSTAMGEVPSVAAYKLAYAWALARSDNRGDWLEANEVSRSIITDNGRSALAHVILGVVLFKLGFMKESESHLILALDIDPERGSYADLGAFYANIGRVDEAENQLREAVRRDPHNSSVRYELGRLLLANNDNLGKAQQEFTIAIKEDPYFELPAIGLAICHFESDRIESAENGLKEAIRRCAGTGSWRLNAMLARMLIRRGEAAQDGTLIDDAYDCALVAINLAPGYGEPYYLAGIAQQWLGDNAAWAAHRNVRYGKAVRYFRECLKRDKGNNEARRRLHVLEARLAESRRDVRWKNLVGGAGITLIVLSITYVAAAFKLRPMQWSLPVFISCFVFGCFMLVIGFLSDSLRKIKATGVMEIEFNVREQAVSVAPVGALTVGIDRFDLPPRPFGDQPHRGDL